MVSTANGDALRIATPPAASRLRVHTPPAPRWGARDDNWTPFTPRRSSRVAAQRHASPISPESPTRLSKKPAPLERMRKTRRITPTTSASEDELRTKQGTATTALGIGDSHPTMLPTPAKTPRTKRQLPKEVLSSASRVLFHGRLANVEDAMPSPKKVRKSKAMSLNSFMDDGMPSVSKIEVYEDSKERIPTVDQDEDNPFLNKTSKPQPTASARTRRKTDRDAKMEESMRKDEGLIYVFRGKKVFRKYSDEQRREGEEDSTSDQELRRRAGGSPTPRIGRSAIKPRILFPNEEQRKARETAAEDADEEALTDIEVPSPTITRTDILQAATETPVITETIQDEQSKQTTGLNSDPQIETNKVEAALPVASQNSEASDSLMNKHLSNTKKPRASSPFDKWSRTKPSVAAVSTEPKSKKRGASPMEHTSKRVRSDSH